MTCLVSFTVRPASGKEQYTDRTEGNMDFSYEMVSIEKLESESRKDEHGI